MRSILVIAAANLVLFAMPELARAGATVEINWSHIYQTMDGFGVAQPGGDLNQWDPFLGEVGPSQDRAWDLYCLNSDPFQHKFSTRESGTACSNAIDDDGDSFVNDGCPALGAAESGAACANSIDDDGDSFINDGCPQICNGGIERDQILESAFSALNGIGLTILRMKINAMMEPLPGVWNYSDPAQAWIMQQATARGPVKIMASVWSPPGWMKPNGRTIGGTCSNTVSTCTLDEDCPGGSCVSSPLASDRYQHFAEFLSHFASQYAVANGVTIHSISFANEPDTYSVPWDTCGGWSSNNIASFLADYLAPRFASDGITAKVIAPEASRWDFVEAVNAQSLFPGSPEGPYLQATEDLHATEQNTAAFARLDIAAGHAYACDSACLSSTFAYAYAHGKPIWQTEYSHVDVTPGAAVYGDLGIVDHITTTDQYLSNVQRIHDSIAGANASAWIWFILYDPYAPGEDLYESKLYYALGNYSKFVRPGFVRISAAVTNTDTSKFLVTAYKDPIMGQLVIVAINKNTSALSVNFNVGFPALATPYVTSDTQDLAQQPDVDLSAAVSVPAQSVVTYVAQPPRLASDMLWRNTNGKVQLWLNAVQATANYPGTVGSDWQIQGVGDFDGNGRSDILWRSINGDNVIWTDTKAPGYWISPVNTAWNVAGIGDFDNNGKSDILWRSINGDNAIWTDANAPGYWIAPLNTDWQMAGVADFDGNGKSDLLWRSVNGDNVIWTDAIAPGYWIPALDTTWRLGGIGDFDGNGSVDILWRCMPQAPAIDCGNAVAGSVALWLFTNGVYTSTSWLGTLDFNWQLTGVGDFDANGRSDILWRCLPQLPATSCGLAEAGATAVWQDGSPGWTTWPGVLDASWQVQGVGRFD